MKKWKWLLPFLLAAALTLSVAACGTVKTHTVTFMDGETLVATQQVEDGGTASQPDPAPVKAGYRLDGWTRNGAAYSLDTPVTADITLQASWSALTVSSLEGSGTAEAPYILGSAEALAFAANAVNNETAPETGKTPYAQGVYRLSADIALGDTRIAIGSAERPFTGTLDGAGFSITGYAASETAEIGLFRYLSGASVRNLKIDASIELETSSVKAVYAGVLAAYAQNSTFTNVTVTGSVALTSKASALESGYLGGVAGYADNCRISYATVSAPLSFSRPDAYAGGVAGYMKKGIIIAADARAAVTAPVAGGVAGYAADKAAILTSVSSAKVTGTSNAGGIVGKLTASAAYKTLFTGSAAAAKAGKTVSEAGGDTVTCYAAAAATTAGTAYVGETTAETLSADALQWRAEDWDFSGAIPVVKNSAAPPQTLSVTVDGVKKTIDYLSSVDTELVNDDYFIRSYTFDPAGKIVCPTYLPLDAEVTLYTADKLWLGGFKDVWTDGNVTLDIRDAEIIDAGTDSDDRYYIDFFLSDAQYRAAYSEADGALSVSKYNGEKYVPYERFFTPDVTPYQGSWMGTSEFFDLFTVTVSDIPAAGQSGAVWTANFQTYVYHAFDAEMTISVWIDFDNEATEKNIFMTLPVTDASGAALTGEGFIDTDTDPDRPALFLWLYSSGETPVDEEIMLYPSGEFITGSYLYGDQIIEFKLNYKDEAYLNTTVSYGKDLGKTTTATLSYDPDLGVYISFEMDGVSYNAVYMRGCIKLYTAEGIVYAAQYNSAFLAILDEGLVWTDGVNDILCTMTEESEIDVFTFNGVSVAESAEYVTYGRNLCIRFTYEGKLLYLNLDTTIYVVTVTDGQNSSEFLPSLLFDNFAGKQLAWLNESGIESTLTLGAYDAASHSVTVTMGGAETTGTFTFNKPLGNIALTFTHDNTEYIVAMNSSYIFIYTLFEADSFDPLTGNYRKGTTCYNRVLRQMSVGDWALTDNTQINVAEKNGVLTLTVANEQPIALTGYTAGYVDQAGWVALFHNADHTVELCWYENVGYTTPILYIDTNRITTAAAPGYMILSEDYAATIKTYTGLNAQGEESTIQVAYGTVTVDGTAYTLDGMMYSELVGGIVVLAGLKDPTDEKEEFSLFECYAIGEGDYLIFNGYTYTEQSLTPFRDGSYTAADNTVYRISPTLDFQVNGEKAGYIYKYAGDADYCIYADVDGAIKKIGTLDTTAGTVSYTPEGGAAVTYNVTDLTDPISGIYYETYDSFATIRKDGMFFPALLGEEVLCDYTLAKNADGLYVATVYYRLYWLGFVMEYVYSFTFETDGTVTVIAGDYVDDPMILTSVRPAPAPAYLRAFTQAA